MAALVSRSGLALKGSVSIPGDKSISHRALMLAALARGASRITGLSRGEDVQKTIQALRSLGVICEEKDDIWTIKGVGPEGFGQPEYPLDLGNSATGVRLMMGMLASTRLKTTFTGDVSLRHRPMDRVLRPLIEMGAAVIPGDVKTLPLTLVGTPKPRPLTFALPVASAQVKSALLLAALNAKGVTNITEPMASRDHTERLLPRFGVPVEVEKASGGGKTISVTGPCKLQPTDISIPGDFSAAAFLLTAALLIPGSEIVIENVGLNPTRAGLLDILQMMGGDIRVDPKGEKSGEPFGDITANYSKLTAVSTDAAQAVGMIDEFPILFVAAACAGGVSTPWLSPSSGLAAFAPVSSMSTIRLSFVPAE